MPGHDVVKVESIFKKGFLLAPRGRGEVRKFDTVRAKLVQYQIFSSLLCDNWDSKNTSQMEMTLTNPCFPGEARAFKPEEV